jgi:WD40-like Beta Propeller Repeat
MKAVNWRVGRWWGYAAIAMGALIWVVGSGGCSSSESGPPGQVLRAQQTPLTTQTAKATQTQMSTARLAMSPRRTWKRFNVDGPWALSPRFVDDALVLLSGRLGQGLLLAGESGAVHVIDPAYKGPVEVRGRVICLPNRRAGVDKAPALPAGWRVAGAEACPPESFNSELGRVLHESTVGRWSFYPRIGELVFVPMGGTAVLVEDRIPFSIQVSPDGRRVAYAVGKLPSPTLILWDTDQGRRQLGVGVHPVFHADGLLLYSRPEGRLQLGSLTTVARAELRAHDLITHESWNLTDTPDLAEMEPALSPDGNRLAFSDWRRGGAYLVTLNRRVAP